MNTNTTASVGSRFPEYDPFPDPPHNFEAVVALDVKVGQVLDNGLQLTGFSIDARGTTPSMIEATYFAKDWRDFAIADARARTVTVRTWLDPDPRARDRRLVGHAADHVRNHLRNGAPEAELEEWLAELAAVESRPVAIDVGGNPATGYGFDLHGLSVVHIESPEGGSPLTVVRPAQYGGAVVYSVPMR